MIEGRVENAAIIIVPVAGNLKFPQFIVPGRLGGGQHGVEIEIRNLRGDIVLRTIGINIGDADPGLDHEPAGVLGKSDIGAHAGAGIGLSRGGRTGRYRAVGPSTRGQERLIKLHAEIDLYIATPVTRDYVTIYLVIASNLDLGRLAGLSRGLANRDDYVWRGATREGEPGQGGMQGTGYLYIGVPVFKKHLIISRRSRFAGRRNGRTYAFRISK